MKPVFFCRSGRVLVSSRPNPLLLPAKIQALIITGQDAHPWRESTPYLKQILEQTGRFEVRGDRGVSRRNASKLSTSTDVVILNYSDEKLKNPFLEPERQGCCHELMSDPAKA